MFLSRLPYPVPRDGAGREIDAANISHPDRRDVKKAVFYPTSVYMIRHHPDILFHPPASLRDDDVIGDILSPNPTKCRHCLKPYLKHSRAPGVAFTILISCPHADISEGEIPLPVNLTIKHMLALKNLGHKANVGQVAVFKHPLSDDKATLVPDLPILDITQEELPLVDDLVSRWVVHLFGKNTKSFS
ncbi:hypothetical protein R3P38DRAFT_3219429 [Favolaschia claudopus]|uniref:Uncharacterized protein n=1 Tax=Favolaschia claudopus TaxID=2862362 RepID=A0AAW0A3B2_9AGAR